MGIKSPPKNLVKFSVLWYFLFTFLLCLGLSITSLGNILFLKQFWLNYFNNPVLYPLFLINAFSYGYVNAFRKEKLETDKFIGVQWTVFSATIIHFSIILLLPAINKLVSGQIWIEYFNLSFSNTVFPFFNFLQSQVSRCSFHYMNISGF